MSEIGLELFRRMYQIRRAEELIVAHYPEDDMKTPMHMSMGQEAAAVAVCQALGPTGQVFGFYRSHAVFLARTGDPRRFFGELYGRVTGTAHGKAGSMHLAAPDKGFMVASAIVGSSIPLALGAAFANKWKANEAIACAYFGDGALEEGVFWESLNAACVMKLPVLFVCEDNGLAVHTHRHVRQGFRRITDVVGQFDCSAFHEDSTDVEVLHEAAATAIASIRSQGRPAFLHLLTRRYLDHIGIVPEYEIGYASRAEFEACLARDSIVLQRRKLLDGGWSEMAIAEEERRIDAELEAGLRQASRAAFPDASELYRGVFHETA